jgi:hypothetical protein
MVCGLILNYHPDMFKMNGHIALPGISIPTWGDMVTGFLVLALPQIPLSLGNSIYASSQMVQDYFPEKDIPPRKIAFTYSIMNILSPLIGGIPVCHGSGGMAGHYTFGARTGGSIVIYGLMFLSIGLLFGANGSSMLIIFPKSILGVILFFEGFALASLVKDMATEIKCLITTMIVGICTVFLPHGYLMGTILGMFIYYAFNWNSREAPNTLYVRNVKD